MLSITKVLGQINLKGKITAIDNRKILLNLTLQNIMIIQKFSEV